MALTRSWGGLEMMALQYAVSFAERGYSSSLVTLKDSPLEMQARSLGLPVLTVEESRYFSPSMTLQIRRFVSDRDVDSIFVHHLRDLWLLRPALVGKSQVAVIGFAHMFIENIRKTDPLHRWLYSRLEKLVALTELQKKELLKCLPMAADDISVIPNGIDFKKFSPSRRDEELRRKLFGVDASRPVVGVVGRLDPQKGQLEFLEAAERVLRERPDTYFVLIGRPNLNETTYLHQLTNFIEQHHLAQSVRIIDHLDDVSGALASLDVFVLPSYKEAFGNVLIEAMASGVPIVATAAGGPSEIIESGRNGLLVRPRCVDGLSTAILEMLSNPDRSKRLAQQALLQGQKKYDLQQTLKRIEELASQPSSSFRETYSAKHRSSSAV